MTSLWVGLVALAVALAQDAQDPPPAPLPDPAPVGEVTPAPKPPVAPLDPPPERRVPDYEARYRESTEATRFLDALALARPEHVRRFELSSSPSGTAVAALEIANVGPIPAAERPTVLLLGGLDGRSLAGSEAVLKIARSFADQPGALGRDLTLIAIPFASPAGLDRAARSGRSDGTDARPIDDDRDGREGEDAPDDLDEDGFVLQMLIEDPDGPWTFSSDPRFLAAARPSDAARFVLAREGRDDDGDGRFNEDAPGGVVLDRNFPVGRDDAWRDPTCGPLPLSEPVSRAIADLALTRRTFACLLFQGNHGTLATPGGTRPIASWSGPDAALYRDCARAFRDATGRGQRAPRTLSEARGAEAPGSAQDWFATVLGALSLEIAPWGPEVDGGSEITVRDARYSSDGEGSETRSAPSPSDRAWSEWLDNDRGGLGFVEWHPIELDGGRRVLVGGFEPWTIENPPPGSLDKALHGMPELVQALVAGAPKLAIDASAERNGSIVTLRARVANRGRWPTALSAGSAVRSAAGATIEVLLPEGARLLAGAARQELPALAGGDSSRDARWIVQLPDGAKLGLRAAAPWCNAVVSEVMP